MREIKIQGYTKKHAVAEYIASLTEPKAIEIVAELVGRTKAFREWKKAEAERKAEMAAKEAAEEIPEPIGPPPQSSEHHTTGGGRRNIRSPRGL